MKSILKVLCGVQLFCVITAGAAFATPSTQIWIPSTDIQPYKTLHLGVDTYVRERKSEGHRGSPVYDLGLTFGVLPFEKLQAEVGIDYMSMGDDVYDNHPLYFNAKVGTNEEALFLYSPALAVGGYGFGIKSNLSDYNILYGLTAKTFPVIGRISAGYFVGNSALLNDEHGANANHGLLLSWDRQLSEISDKLWAGVDYQGGNSSFGAISFGISWAFAKNVSVLLGYDIYNNRSVAYNSTDRNVNSFTTQLDINIP